MKQSIVAITLVFLPMTYVVAAECDRVVYPKTQTIDLSALGELIGNNEHCQHDTYTIRCKDERTQKVICLKCIGGAKWSHLKDRVYRCSDLMKLQ